MSGKISDFFCEFKLGISVILTILGLILFIIGAAGTFEIDFLKNTINLSNDFWDWSIYVLVIGFIVLAFGLYYLYIYLKNRKFILGEIKTNKRSELLKRHSELKNTVKHMPKKYKKMLKDKEQELKIR